MLFSVESNKIYCRIPPAIHLDYNVIICLTRLVCFFFFFRPQIHVKKLYGEKKQVKPAKKLATGEFFFTFVLQFSTFGDS